MKLYVCWGTWKRPGMGPHGTHFCGTAYHALREAGHDPAVERTYGLGKLGPRLNPTRRKIEQLTGNVFVPTLVLDDGTVVDGSEAIVAWARANPATPA
ncbi:MAG TPA: hypothetical protein VN238_14275 [Solirubrobacteraceae bacterium]|nr:hypothetical protein [Solirubrobacteraceae bacterium]